MRELLNSGTDVNQTSERGQTALMLAAVFGHEEIAKLLLATGADVRLMDSLGLTAADWSTRRGFSKLAQLIANTNGPTDLSLHRKDHSIVSAPAPRSIQPENTKAQTGETERPKSGLLAVLRTRAAQANAAAHEAENSAPSNLSSRNEVSNQSVFPEPPPTLESVDGRITNLHSEAEGTISESPKPAVRMFSSVPLQASPISVPLEDFETPSFAQISTTASGRSMLWAMIAVTLLGAAYVTYRLTNRSPEKLAPAPATATKPTEAQPKVAPAKPLPVVAGELAGAELDVPDAKYAPTSAGRNGDDVKAGTVTVRIQVNRKGNVTATRVLSGPLSLRMAAIQAARKATFAPEKHKNKLRTGTIAYEFVTPPSPPPASTGSPTASTSASEAPAVPNPNENLPVTGDALAGTEIDLPQAEYPKSLLRQHISGTIVVTVRVNRAGKVISWLTSKGDIRLRAAALKAAKKAHFNPAKLSGKGEVVGTITYNFKL